MSKKMRTVIIRITKITMIRKKIKVIMDNQEKSWFKMLLMKDV